MKKYFKIFVFLMTIICINKATNVQAEEYISDTIDFGVGSGVYATYQDDTSTRYFEVKTAVNKNDEVLYTFIIQQIYAEKLAVHVIDRPDHMVSSEVESYIQEAIRYGYLYQDHTDIMWYVATQHIIWEKYIEQNGGTIIYKDMYGNNLDSTVLDYANRIKTLMVSSHNTQNLSGNYEGLVGSNIELQDDSSTLEAYSIVSKDDNVLVDGNKILFNNLKEGEQSITISRSTDEERNGKMFTYYSSPKAYPLLIYGGKLHDEELVTYTVTGIVNSINITKIDSDTNSTTPQGEASLAGAKYGIYDSKTNKLVSEGVIDSDGSLTIKNIPNGTYYLQEIEAGVGYTLNNEKIYFEFNDDTHNINYTLKNTVIKKEVTLHKEFGLRGSTTAEEDITFEIYDSNDNLVATITTNNNGDATCILPYGKYTVKQINSSDGYTKVDDFVIRITEQNKDYYYKLFDYKLEDKNIVSFKVPNTGIKESNIEFLFLVLFLFPFILKKKNVN